MDVVNEALRHLSSPAAMGLRQEVTMNQDRPNKNAAENGNLKPDREGKPPRPATEPDGAKGSSNSRETETDPATGEPNS